MDPGLIRAALAKHRLRKDALAKKLGMSPQTLSALLVGERQIKVDELPIIVDYCGLDRVDVVAMVGPRGLVTNLPADDIAQIKLPFVPPAKMLAVRVAGEQLWPRYGEGDVIVAWAAQRWPLARYFESEVLADLAAPDGQPLGRFLGRLTALPGQPAMARLLGYFVGHQVDGQPTWIGEIALQIRANQLHEIAPGLFSAIPDPLK